MFLKYKSTSGKKYSLIASQIRALASEGSGTRIWASIAGMPVTFVTARPHEEVEKEIEETREQDTSA
jgi:hypothetical protein